MVTNELLSHGEVLVNGDAVRARQVANQIALRNAIERFCLVGTPRCGVRARGAGAASASGTHLVANIPAALPPVTAQRTVPTNFGLPFHRDVKSAQSFVSVGPEGVGTHLNGDVAADVRKLEKISDFRFEPRHLGGDQTAGGPGCRRPNGRRFIVMSRSERPRRSRRRGSGRPFVGSRNWADFWRAKVTGNLGSKPSGVECNNSKP